MEYKCKIKWIYLILHAEFRGKVGLLILLIFVKVFQNYVKTDKPSFHCCYSGSRGKVYGYMSVHNLAILPNSVHHRIKPKTVLHRAFM